MDRQIAVLGRGSLIGDPMNLKVLLITAGQWLKAGVRIH
jgi:hypothetical protein